MRASAIFGRVGPRHPRLAAAGAALTLPLADRVYASAGFVRASHPRARERSDALRATLDRGGEAYLLGLGVAGHNTGASLVRVSARSGMELLSNDEEERYVAHKHCADFPEHSLAATRERLAALGLTPDDLHACVASWDYAAFCALAVRTILEEAPASMAPQPQAEVFNTSHVVAARKAPRQVWDALGLTGRPLIVGIRHHDTHAAFSYAASPFAHDGEPVLVTVLDGFGDHGTSSIYLADRDGLRTLRAEPTSFNDSLGVMYGVLSSTQGGWPLLSSEGRYMGAAAWGDGNRLTNPYYRRLRQVFHFGGEGRVQLNRALGNWTASALGDPYTEELVDILGEPIPHDRMWHPDAVLDVDAIRHAEVTPERVDKAAAVQLVFEDALLHVLDHFLRATGATRLVLTGGTALNCIANMRVLDAFDEGWYRRALGRPGRLSIWVPPVPGDAGAPTGAAHAFAMAAGARPGPRLTHAFHCGRSPRAAEVRAAVARSGDVGTIELGDVSEPEGREAVADLMAHVVAHDGVLGIFQGAAETGPRALGHRSILANPTNPDTLRLLNERVKYRERIRPLAPMLTPAAARELFELSSGAAAEDYAAYDWMVLTARARPAAHALIPAVIHEDGTGRLQIVREEIDPLCHAYLRAMGRHAGVEASVNTSLNVGAPIALTVDQAVETLRRSKGMDGIVVVSEDGNAQILWLESRRADHEERLAVWLAERASPREPVRR